MTRRSWSETRRCRARQSQSIASSSCARPLSPASATTLDGSGPVRVQLIVFGQKIHYIEHLFPDGFRKWLFHRNLHEQFCEVRFRYRGKTGQQAMEAGWVDGQVVFMQLVNQFIKVIAPGPGLPSRLALTNVARKSVKGPILLLTLAASSAAI